MIYNRLMYMGNNYVSFTIPCSQVKLNQIYMCGPLCEDPNHSKILYVMDRDPNFAYAVLET